MSYRSIFDAKTPTVDAYLVFDFSSGLAPGETVASAVTTSAVYSGTEGITSPLVSGAATISGGKVTQTIQGGLAGTAYTLLCVAVTSSSNILSRQGYLVVKDLGI